MESEGFLLGGDDGGDVALFSTSPLGRDVTTDRDVVVDGREAGITRSNPQKGSTELAPRPIQFISRDVCLFVRVCVCDIGSIPNFPGP